MAGNQGLHSAENGKKGGRPRLEATKFREALIRKIEERADGLADALLDKAMTGDVPALREVADRALGKSMQPVDVTTNGKDIPTPIFGNYVHDDDGHEEGGGDAKEDQGRPGGDVGEQVDLDPAVPH